MKNIMMTIILFALCAALVVSVVIPVTQQIKDVGQKSYDTVKDMSSSIREGT